MAIRFTPPLSRNVLLTESSQLNIKELKHLEILLIRHAESEANARTVDPQHIGAHNVKLTAKGREEAFDLGVRIKSEIFEQSIIYESPYHRAKETLDCILDGAGILSKKNELLIYEDPRLREVEHSFHYTKKQVDEQKSLRETHGYFYYRYIGGESPADCFDRVSTFLESLQRQCKRKNKQSVIIISHGLTIRCFVMRFLGLTVEEFEQMDNPDNCDCIRIARKELIPNSVFSNEKWAVSGIKLNP